MLGFDVLIDSKLKPWMIEINISPSFNVDSPIDFRIKKGVVEETIKILGLSQFKKIKYKKKEKSKFQKRVLTGKIERKTIEEKTIIKQGYDLKRSEKVK